MVGDYAKVAAGAVVLIVFQFSLPDDLSLGGQAGRAMGAKMNIDVLAVDDRRRRGMAVFIGDAAQVLLAKHFDVVQHGSGFSVQAYRPQRLFGIDRGGQPDLPGGHDRRRPAQARHGHFPADVLRFAPRAGQARGRRVSLAVGAAELRPVFGGRRRREEPGQQSQHQGQAACIHASPA